jgi:hypothetical protein
MKAVRTEITMHIAIIGAFVMILLARPFGKWRAKIWLKELVSSRKEEALGDRVSGHDRVSTF